MKSLPVYLFRNRTWWVLWEQHKLKRLANSKHLSLLEVLSFLFNTMKALCVSRWGRYLRQENTRPFKFLQVQCDISSSSQNIALLLFGGSAPLSGYVISVIQQTFPPLTSCFCICHNVLQMSVLHVLYLEGPVCFYMTQLGHANWFWGVIHSPKYQVIPIQGYVPLNAHTIFSVNDIFNKFIIPRISSEFCFTGLLDKQRHI